MEHDFLRQCPIIDHFAFQRLNKLWNEWSSELPKRRKLKTLPGYQKKKFA